MANNNNSQPSSKETSTHLQPIQHNGIEMTYSSQPEKFREKPQQTNRPKKTSQHRRKPTENERDRQKAEVEKSENELKSLLTQFGSKAKAADELDRDATKLRSNLESLLNRVQNKGKPPQPTQIQTTSENWRSSFLTVWNGIISFVIFIITLIRRILGTVYRVINLRTLLLVILFIELAVVILIWTIKRTHHTYLYVEPYEAVVHGTFGVEQSTSWNFLWSFISSIQDFFAEVMNGGRGFGSPGYDGFVPT
ncbi:12181_t:CDS:2 [Acaulospora morrowiae]|uniref:12181_t:CDS:1 n=1 Tax=Acaulospora morrowiae TaxID=94023 RepID=A0A9N8VAF0_9GLOM|nr:12181_t:CDS:2 [Acaulospora morrowiae]